MSLLFRYLFRESLAAVSLALGVLTLVVLLPQVMKLVEMWVSQNAPLTVLGQLILWSIPKLMVGSLPMALVLGLLLVLGRLSQESEVVVMRACGISLYQMSRPLAVVVLLLGLLSLLLNLHWVPEARLAFNIARNQLGATMMLNLQGGTFSQPTPGLTLYINQVEPGSSLLRGILIHDERTPNNPVTLQAQRGVFQTTAQGGGVLLLQEGSRHFITPNNRYRQMEFTTYAMDLGWTRQPGDDGHDGDPRVMPQSRLQELMRSNQDPGLTLQAAMEWHRRLAIPVGTIILGMLAIPLGIHSHRAGRAYGFLAAVITLVVHFVLLSLGESLAKRQYITPLVGYWTPNGLMFLFTLYVTYATSRGHPFGAAAWLATLLEELPHRLLAGRKRAEG